MDWYIWFGRHKYTHTHPQTGKAKHWFCIGKFPYTKNRERERERESRKKIPNETTNKFKFGIFETVTVCCRLGVIRSSELVNRNSFAGKANVRNVKWNVDVMVRTYAFEVLDLGIILKWYSKNWPTTNDKLNSRNDINKETNPPRNHWGIEVKFTKYSSFCCIKWVYIETTTTTFGVIYRRKIDHIHYKSCDMHCARRCVYWNLITCALFEQLSYQSSISLVFVHIKCLKIYSYCCTLWAHEMRNNDLSMWKIMRWLWIEWRTNWNWNSKTKRFVHKTPINKHPAHVVRIVSETERQKNN